MDDLAPTPPPPRPPSWPVLLLAWGLVGLPLAWGIFQTVRKAAQLFR